MRAIRGAEIGMVFQEPMAALNPIQTVGRQIAEVFRLHTGLSPPRGERRLGCARSGPSCAIRSARAGPIRISSLAASVSGR